MEEEEAAHSLGCPRGGQIVELENESQQNQIRPSFLSETTCLKVVDECMTITICGDVGATFNPNLIVPFFRNFVLFCWDPKSEEEDFLVSYLKQFG